MRVGHPGEVVEGLHLEVRRHDAQGARVDVPARHRHRHVAPALAQFLHDGRGTARVVGHAGVQLFQELPGVVPALDRVVGVLVLQQVGQAHQKGAPGARVGWARVQKLARVGLAPGEQFGRRLGRVGHRLGVVLEQRAALHEAHLQPIALGQLLHLGCRRVVLVGVGLEHAVVLGQELEPQALLDAGGQRVGAGQHQIDVGAPGRLHGLDLAGDLRRGGVGEGHARHQIRVLVAKRLQRLLRDGQVARHVHDVQRDRRGLRQRGGARQGRGAGQPGQPLPAGNAGSAFHVMSPGVFKRLDAARDGAIKEGFLQQHRFSSKIKIGSIDAQIELIMEHPQSPLAARCFAHPLAGGIASGRGDPGRVDRGHGLLRGLSARWA